MAVPEDADGFADYLVTLFKANPEEAKKQMIERYSPPRRAYLYRASKAEVEREKAGWGDLQ